MPARLLTILVALVMLSGSAAQAADKARDLAAAYNRTGIALFEKLAGDKGNAVISPYSIGSAMAMVTAGARGETADEMAGVLSLPGDPAEIGASVEALDGALAKPEAEEDAAIAVANALHVTRPDGVVSDDYALLLKTKFGAEIFNGSDLDKINGWVADKTQGRIEKILESLDPLSVYVLLNAVYFKSSWQKPFKAGKTAPADFHLSADETVKVPTMNVTGKFSLVNSTGFDAIALPYKGGRFAMVVLLPEKAGAAGEVDIRLDQKKLDSLLAELREADTRYLALAMPKFKAEYGADLVPPFDELGIKRAFDSTKSDFSGMMDNAGEGAGLYVSKIRHKAFVEVDETGTEAAAATAVEMTARSLPPIALPFSIDRPFLYLIVEMRTGAVLFLGRVSDPRG